jgi:hypothetical protein
MQWSLEVSGAEFIRCPGCEMPFQLARRVCPGCQRCPHCGSSQRQGTEECACWQADDPREIETLVQRHGIPADQVEIELRRFVIRKELRIAQTALTMLLSGIVITAIQAMLKPGPALPVGAMDRLFWGIVGLAASYLITIAIRPYFRRIEIERLAADLKERPIGSAVSV